MKKLILGLSLSTLIGFSLNAMAGCNDNNECEWDCSPAGKTTCTATFKNGTLTISGTEMANYTVPSTYTEGYFTSTAPWNDEAGHMAQITNVVIGENMQNLGSFAFANATNLEHISIPDNITSVGDRAFYHTGLKSVDWPSNLTTVTSGVFQYAQLSDLSAFEGVTTIGYAAFDGCFRYNDSPTSITIPDSVETIDGYAFNENGNHLSSVILGNNVNQIASDAFNNGYLSTVYCQETDGHGKSCADLLENTTGALQTFAKDGDYYVLTDTNGNSTGEYFGSTSDMVKGSDYSCGATTSICATVLSEVGGANCDTIKSCRNLAEMADENVYCNSMSTCKELTDLVVSETYCDSLDSCKALSDMAASGEYCTTVAECKALNDMVGGENCDSLESCKALSDMASSGEYCSTVAECKRFMDLMNSGYCEGFDACKEMFNADVINYDGKRYSSLDDLYNGNALPSITRQEQGDGSFAVYKDGVFVGYKGKRIYTTEEANRVTKPMGNTFKIKYR